MEDKKTVLDSDLPDDSNQRPPLDGSCLGKYHDLKLIGEGGQAFVYSAKDTTLGGRVVALKVLKKRGINDAENLERFRREINLQAKLDIPGCVKIYECGEEEGWFFFAMELIDGKQLYDINFATITLDRKILILKKVAEILSELHKRNLTHRDIKLQNVMIDGRGEVKLLDFGLMKDISEYPVDMFRTRQGIFTGTPACTAPELTAKLDNARCVSKKSGDLSSYNLTTKGDIFSLGVMAYELFTGKYPFEIEGLDMYEALEVIRSEEPVALDSLSGDIPKSVVKVVMRALAKNPAERPSAAKFAEELQNGLEELRKPPLIRQLAIISSGVIIALIILLVAIHETGIPEPFTPDEHIAAVPDYENGKTLFALFHYLDSFGMRLVKIQPGTFFMGSDNGDSDELPIHTVKLNDKFWIGNTEVTVDLYNRITHSESQTGASKIIKIQHLPVSNVSWYDADRFCRDLTKKLGEELPEGYIFRLPTEAEWEYCCRAGSESWYSFGNMDDELAEFAVFNTRRGGPANVASKAPNSWGIYDMHGNVWEWCFDSKIKYSGDIVENPVGSLFSPMRVARGGAFSSPASACRSANRIDHPKSYKNSNLGFRIVLAKRVK